MGSGTTQNKTVSGEDSRMATISELTKETVYTVEVAAETRAGTGVYSLPLTIQTPDSECVYLFVTLSLYNRTVRHENEGVRKGYNIFSCLTVLL